MSLPLPPSAQDKFEITLPPELYIMIAEELGKEIDRMRANGGDLNDHGQDNGGGANQNDDDAVTRVDWVVSYMQQMLPTSSMLNVSMVNKYFREKILGIALRWDAQSENPKAIYHAAVNNHTKLLKHALAQQGAKPNHAPHGFGLSGWTPLMMAAWRGHLEVVELLIQAGAEVEQGGTWEWSWRAGSFVESPTTMLMNAMSFNLLPSFTALHCAMLAVRKPLAIAKRILQSASPQFNQKIADPSEKIFATAVSLNMVDLVRPLINRGADFHHGGETTHSMSVPVLHHAVSGKMVETLVQAGACVETPVAVGLNALHAVCLRQMDCECAVRALVHLGVDVNEVTAGGSQRAALVGVHPVLREMIPQTALNIACRQLNLLHIRALLELGANALGADQDMTAYTDFTDGEFFQVTPLHDLFLPENIHINPIAGNGNALSHTLSEAVDLLLGHGGSPALVRRQNVCIGTDTNVRSKIDQSYWVYTSILRTSDVGRYTPFQLFFMRPLVDDVQIPNAMLHACDDVREQLNAPLEPYGITLLIALLSHRFDHSYGQENFYRPKLVEWLLEHGADPNITDKEGMTPLHYAVFWLDFEAVTLLLSFGATASKSDFRPLEVAVGRVYTEEHIKSEVDDSLWKRMVKLVDTWDRERYGLASCVRRWQPGRPLPVCVLPSFETNMEPYVDEEELHRDIREVGYINAMRQETDARKRKIFDCLLPYTGQLRKPGGSRGDGAHPVASILDWACATSQPEWLVMKLIDAGALMGASCPVTTHATLHPKVFTSAWDLWRVKFVFHFPEVLQER